VLAKRGKREDGERKTSMSERVQAMMNDILALKVAIFGVHLDTQVKFQKSKVKSSFCFEVDSIEAQPGGKSPP
jgi:hypothetical protein